VNIEVHRPTLLVIAGPNGSVKTTLTTRLRQFGLDFGEYINADEIALELPASSDRDRLAQLEADRRRRVCLDGRQSFSFETVMSHPSKIEEMREAKALGFNFIFYFIAVSDPQINLKRVEHRVLSGGHDVPSDRVVARYHRTMALMPQAVVLADKSFIFDNSDVVRGPQLVAEFRNIDGVLNLFSSSDFVESNYETMPEWVRIHVFSGITERIGKGISVKIS
jgi:predicted ABC-type ATPase